MTVQAGRNLEIVCAGIIIADCVARPVERWPERGQLGLVKEISLQLGGSAANTGAQLVRLGHRVGVAGRVGQDSFGEFMVNELTRLGVDVQGVKRDADHPSSATIVQVDADGERTFLHSLGADAAVCAGDFALEDWQARGAQVLHVAGFHILPGLEPQLPELFARASALGLTTSLDCVWDASGQWQAIRAALPHTDLFCPSLAEARGITGKDAPEQVADALFALGVRQAVALKMGKHGSYVQARGQLQEDAHFVVVARFLRAGAGAAPGADGRAQRRRRGRHRGRRRLYRRVSGGVPARPALARRRAAGQRGGGPVRQRGRRLPGPEHVRRHLGTGP